MNAPNRVRLFSILPLLLTAVGSAVPTSIARAQNQTPTSTPAPAPAPAQTTPPGSSTIELTPQKSPERPITFQLRGGGEYTFSSDIDDSPGDIGIARTNFGVGIGIPIGERSRLSLDVDEEVSWYFFDNAPGLVPGTSDPFELALSTQFQPTFSSQIDERWSWFVGGIVNFAGEADADIGESATYGGFGGARYRFSDTFALSFGLGARTRLEDSTFVIPLIGIEWKVSDRVTVASEGTHIKITAQMNQQLAVTLSGGWELREYRLDDTGPLPDGVARDRRVPVGVTLDWKPADNVQLSLGGGVVVWQEFRFDDRNGDRVSETNTNPAAFVGVSGKFTF
ncbi:MAG: hypothetical protein H7210_00960 [Pyrinomonadaceae bacterium]|nr:hypothetical protein [Phycisphaerales bacterium]